MTVDLELEATVDARELRKDRAMVDIIYRLYIVTV